MDRDKQIETHQTTPEEQDRLEKAQMICDRLVIEMEMRIDTDKKHCIDSSSLVEIVDGDDIELAGIVQSVMMMVKGYFRYQGYETHVSYTGGYNDEKQPQHEYKIEIQHRTNSDGDFETTQEEQ